MKNLVRILTAAVCTAALSIQANMKGDLLEIPMTYVTPVIDGKMDAIWKVQDNNFMNYYSNGESVPDGYFDLMGWTRLMWDDQFIYGFFYAQDDIIIDEHPNAYEKDSWEVYFDADNSKGCTAANRTDYDGVNDIQLRLGHSYGTDVTKIDVGLPVAWASGAFWANAGWDRAADGVKMAVADTALGYIIEWKIPLESLYIDWTPETQIGIEFQLNDNDTDKRDHIAHWWIPEGDPSWNNAATFGTALLSGRGIGEEFTVLKASSAPAIDGDLDDVWLNDSNIFSNNFYINSGTEPDDYSDLYGSTRLMWDATNIYGFWTVWDDIINDEHANAYEKDGVECYFDADNSKGTTAVNGTDYDGVNDIQLRFNHAYGTDVSKIDVGLPVAWASGEFWAMGSWDRAAAGVAMAVKDTDIGYNIEWQMPLESLYLDATPGTQFGFETQINDNDSDKRDHISHWWIETGDPSWNNAACWGTAVFRNYGWYTCCGKTSRKSIVCPDAVKGNEIPSGDSFLLAQNYPNPFNPSTRILYCLKTGGKVRLSLFDLTGREISVLMDGFEQAGDHQVRLELSGLASGVYFYRLETEDGVLTRKMSLMR